MWMGKIPHSFSRDSLFEVVCASICLLKRITRCFILYSNRRTRIFNIKNKMHHHKEEKIQKRGQKEMQYCCLKHTIIIFSEKNVYSSFVIAYILRLSVTWLFEMWLRSEHQCTWYKNEQSQVCFTFQFNIVVKYFSSNFTLLLMIINEEKNFNKTGRTIFLVYHI